MHYEVDATRPYKEKTAARTVVVQCVYGYFIGNNSLEAIWRDRLLEDTAIDEKTGTSLINCIANEQDILQQKIVPHFSAGWTWEKVQPLMQALLLVAVAEKFCFPNIKRTILIDEYLDIAHGFFAAKECAFVNKMLDTVYKTMAQ